MLVFKYKKTDTGVFWAHLDTLRAINYIIRRAQLSIDFSQGFNPHMLMYFSTPIGIGIYSDCEYCAVSTKESAQAFKEKFNSFSVKALQITDIVTVNKNPNLAANINLAEYVIEIDNYNEIKNKLEDFYKNNDIIITKLDSKKIPKQVNVNDKIKSMEFLTDKIICKLDVGSSNLRADVLLKSLFDGAGVSSYGNKITKTRMFKHDDSGKTVLIDDYIKTFI